MLIGLVGKIGSGKDTVAGIIQELFPEHNWQIKKFAGKLKQVASILTGIPVEDFEKQEVKDSFLGPEWGLKNSDDTVYLMTVRKFLQKLGTDAIRNNLHPNTFVNSLIVDFSGYEEWRDIEYSGGNYIVSSLGRIMSVNRITKPRGSQKTRTVRAKILKPTTGSKGYDTVGINNKTITVHQLVARAFIPNPRKLTTVNHINGIRNDNRVQNLEWVTQNENIIHAIASGRFNSLLNRKLSQKDVIDIIEKLNCGQTGSSLSKEYNVSQSTISAIKHGEKYREITDPNFKPVEYKPSIHEVIPNWLVTDVRFLNEIEAIQKRSGIILRVVRENNPYPTSDHVSETALDHLEFETIHNNGTLEDLKLEVKRVLQKICHESN